jgi:large subunit ribosomal protein L24
MKILLNDLVQVMTGKDKGKSGKVKRILKKAGRIVVEGLNMVTRHVKASQGNKGQKIVVEAPIHASNIMAVCPKTKKPTRLGYKIAKSGEKVRIAKVSGEVMLNKSFKSS